MLVQQKKKEEWIDSEIVNKRLKTLLQEDFDQNKTAGFRYE